MCWARENGLRIFNDILLNHFTVYIDVIQKFSFFVIRIMDDEWRIQRRIQIMKETQTVCYWHGSKAGKE